MISSVLAALRRSLFVRDAGALWVAEVVALAIGLAQAIFVARLLGPGDYGLAALIMTVPTFIFTLIDPQSQEALVKYVGEASRVGMPVKALAVVKLAYLTDLVLALVGVALTAVVAAPASRLVVGDASSIPLILTFAVLLMTAAPTATSRAVLVTFGRFREAAVAQACVSGLRGLIVVLAALSGGVTGVVIGSGIALLIDAIVGVLLAQRALVAELGGEWRHAPLGALGADRRPILRFMAYTELTTLASVFVKHGDTVILGALSSATQVGYYRLARTAGTLVGSLIVPLQTAVYPRFVREGEDGERAVSATSRRALLFVGGPLALVTAMVTPAVPTAIRLLAGPAYLPAARTAQVFLLGSAVTLAFFWVRPAALAIGRVRFLFGTSTAIVAVSLIGFVAVAGESGALGVSVVRTLAVGVAGNVVSAAYLALKARAPRLRAAL